MSDFTVRSDSINVEQIMDQIRTRIREKRGVDYSEDQIRELAAVKLEKFLDPRGVRSDLLEQFKRARPAYQPPELPNYAFEEQTLFDSHRGLLRLIRRLLGPVLKLFFNPNPLIQSLNIQSRLNTSMAEREARREADRHAFEQLYYEVVHNLVTETTRLSIEVKNLKMRVESLTSRLEFNERRARALESVVVYQESPERPGEAPVRPSQTAGAAPAPPREGAAVENNRPQAPGTPSDGPGQRSRRRRRRRGRRGTGSAAALMGAPAGANAPQSAAPESSAWTGDRQGDQIDLTEPESATDGDDDAGDPGDADPSDHRQ